MLFAACGAYKLAATFKGGSFAYRAGAAHDPRSMAQIAILNGGFAALWLGSAWLFRWASLER